ncbi:MAG: helix-turn-helix transcriptional regulator, partial [Parabacteroides sp.]|nr:helix-turn-helix transcriptional regulator [Parabacteroides sp.]
YFFYLSSTHSAEFERLIAENYIKAKTVTDLAQMIGYGVNSFRMKFKKAFGIPAYEWLMQEKSKRLLVAIANSEDDFKNIIDEFDFSSHSHFYKFCKARFGYSPTELRKKLKSL